MQFHFIQRLWAQGTFGNENIKVQKINFKGEVYSVSSARQTICDALSSQLVKWELWQRNDSEITK